MHEEHDQKTNYITMKKASRETPPLFTSFQIEGVLAEAQTQLFKYVIITFNKHCSDKELLIQTSEQTEDFKILNYRMRIVYIDQVIALCVQPTGRKQYTRLISHIGY